MAKETVENPSKEVKSRFDELMETKVTSGSSEEEKKELEEKFLGLRRVILFSGMGEPQRNPDGETNFRGQVWKLLLGVLYQDKKKDPVEEYLKLLGLGKATKYKTRSGESSYKAIRHDSFRTLKGAKLFDIKTEEPKVIRVLNAYVHKARKPYNQGMNTILSPFLVCMNEMDAFYCFYTLLEKMTPTYWMGYKNKGPGTDQGFYLGAHAACRLADKVLQEVDYDLHESLMNNVRKTFRTQSPRKFFHKLYTFRHMQVFSLVAKPMEEVMQLWDLFFALGMHMHVVAYVAQLILIRHLLMDENANLNNLLTQEAWPKVNARAVTSVTTFVMPKLSEELVEELKNHVTDKELCCKLVDWDSDTHPTIRGRAKSDAETKDTSDITKISAVAGKEPGKVHRQLSATFSGAASEGGVNACKMS